MSGCPAWWIPPFVAGCLLVRLQTAFQAANAEEEEEGWGCIVLSSDYLVVLTSAYLGETNFTNSLHSALQPPSIWSWDKAGLQTSVTADCPCLLTLSACTQTKPAWNCSGKNKFSLKLFLSPFSVCIDCSVPLFTSCFCKEKEHPLGIFSISCIWLLNFPLEFVVYFTAFLAILLCPSQAFPV